MKEDEFKNRLNFLLLMNDNRCYFENMYEKFLENPNSIDKSWKYFFNKSFYTSSNDKTKFCENKIFDTHTHIRYISSTLIDTFRRYGHKFSYLDPLNLQNRESFPEIDFFLNGIDSKLINTNFAMHLSKLSFEIITLKKLYSIFHKIYCSNIGYEYMHIDCENEKKWIQNYIERDLKKNLLTNVEKKNLLNDLISAEALEKYFGYKFPGSKRFSLEGAESLIPLLQAVSNYNVKLKIDKIVLGMSHRGRLNVLINILNKPIKEIFNEFSEVYDKKTLKNGDVKYHMGFKKNKVTKLGIVNLDLKFNPSHLEIINPVVAGSVRAHQDNVHSKDKTNILAVVLHGDAAISGQGIVQETLNMSMVRGYKVNGTLHIVLNNQIGFTTSYLEDLRSSKYCTDIAKMVESPIFHVNSDDPESILFVVQLALEFRNNFKKDVFIDLVCYRRHGHNEVDDPYVTQPMMYSKIKKHPTICQIYNTKLMSEKIIDCSYLDEQTKKYQKMLNEQYSAYKQKEYLQNSSYCKYNVHTSCSQKIKIIEKIKLQELGRKINVIPSNIVVHKKVIKIYQDRLKMINGEKPLDWGAAEILAYASLLNQGISCRLSGEDVERGTFFHRHATIYDQKNGKIYIPLQNIHNKQGKFYIWNSTLSEEAVLAFEYGYSINQKNTLTIWEAQFGDFANGAQIVIDQFICSSKTKWDVSCNLIMLLPHGYEGQGPEHSSSRIERYLQLSSENNIQICIPTTASQMYHVLCRQSLNNIQKPLIIMTPKSLLRHPLASSPLHEFSKIIFKEIIDEIDDINIEKVKRIILCSGKIYYDLLHQRRENRQNNIVILRIEQLYPFPNDILLKILQSYLHVKDFIWCQEEPFNQGAWFYSQYCLKKILPKNSSLNYIGRSESSSTATGYISVHKKQQQQLVNDALNIS
ncbi:MAG: 2-oxoglutarate dehydrogenase E1 component [Buchnera aphidicola (Nurudea ibofushi)]